MTDATPRLEDIGSGKTITVDPSMPMSQAVRLMDENRISCLVVTDDNRRPVGILTERDLVRYISRDPSFGSSAIGTFMSSPPIVAPKGLPYLEGYNRCAEHGVRHLILVDDEGLLAGIVTETDFMDHLGLDAYVELKPVASVMTRRPLTVQEDQPLSDAWSLMSDNGISCVVVEREGRPVGILSERDMVHLSQTIEDLACPVREVMSIPVITVTAGESVHEAANIMRKRRIRRLAVVDDAGQLIGVVTGHDVVKGLESRYTTFLRQVIARQSKELTSTRRRLNESLVLENILRASFNMAILATDMAQRVWYFNPAAESIFGMAADKAIGVSLDALYGAADFDPAPLAEGTQMARHGGDHEFEIQKGEGVDRRVLQCRMAPIKDRQNRNQGYVHTLTDVTAGRKSEEERERLHSELLQARKMEAIGQLTGGIAHDFNNILASVLGYTRLAQDCYDSDDAGKIPGYLSEVHYAGKRAQDLVRQLLTFSRSSPQRPQRLDLGVMIKEVTRMLRATLPSTLSLRLELNEGTPAVHLDPVQVQQLLMNLMLNARDAIDGHGTVTVGLRLLRRVEGVWNIAHRPIQGDWVELSVADTGPGMSPEVQERIFEPFFTTKEIGRGSGMGLAVVHGIVTQNDGEIVVDSTPGRGACFRLLFRPSESTEKPAKKIAGHPGRDTTSAVRGMRILVADDDASVAGFISELLERAGHVPTVVANGQEALDAIKRSPTAFDLVITDQVMPRLTGLELASRLHEMRPNLPVVLATGFGDYLSPDKVTKTGPLEILTKPIEPEDLMKAIESFRKDGNAIA